MSNVIDGIKLIRHYASNVNVPDDTSYPFKLEALLQPPRFMLTMFALNQGMEEVVVRGMTKEALEEFIEKNDLRTHPRLHSLTITGPEGVIPES